MTSEISPEPTGNGVHSVSPKKRGNYLWLWFFLILALLAVSATGFLWWYNLGLQLTPEQLAAAWKLWEEHGPKDYDLEYTEKGSVNQAFTVHVQNGEVVDAKLDGRPVNQTLEQMKEYYGMEAMFRYLEGFMKRDLQPSSPKTYVRANFDPIDGHLLHYVRRVMGTPERLEITVDLTPVSPSKAKP